MHVLIANFGFNMRFLKLFFLSLLWLQISCADTVVGGDCEPGQTYNPIAGACEIKGRENPNNHAPSNHSNNRNNTQKTNGKTTVGCIDCVAELVPNSIAFEFTPVLETSVVNVVLKNISATEIKVKKIEWENTSAGEFTLMGVVTTDMIPANSVRSLAIQYSPKDLRPDTLRLNIFFEGSTKPALLDITTKLIGNEVCTENCARIQVSPRQMHLSYQPNTPSGQSTIAVGSVGQASLVIKEILLLQQGAEFSLTHDPLPLAIRASGTANLDLTFTIPNGGSPTGSILIRSNDPFTPEITIPISARKSTKGQVGKPCIEVAPRTLNFGSLARGQSLVKSFMVKNCGVEDLVISDIQRGTFFGFPTSQAFQVTGWSQGMLAAGTAQQVDITFTPRRAGFTNGSFNVRSNATNAPSVRVNVRAKTKTPPIADQDIHIEVRWDTDETDVDTHVLLLPGTGMFCQNDCYFSNAEPDWGVVGDWEDDPFLDTDDTDGHGPENVNIKKGINGKRYRVALHYWDDSTGESSFATSSKVRVKLFIRGVLKQTWGPIKLDSTRDTKDVFEIEWPSQRITTFNNPIYQVRSQTSCRPTP